MNEINEDIKKGNKTSMNNTYRKIRVFRIKNIL